MEGSAKIISLIARDENQHLAITQNILKKWAEGDDLEMQQIAKEEEQWLISTFENCVNQEKLWAEYLFKDGSMIGLNDKLLQQYVEWIANRRMQFIGLKPIYDVPAKNNPLPWTEHWISSKGLQVAPQETEVESYIVGGIKQDVKKDTFSGFNFEEIWKEMDEIEPLTPKQEKREKSLESYKEAAKHDAYLFGDYDAYSAYEEGSKTLFFINKS